MPKIPTLFIACVGWFFVFFATIINAHHSFAIYDIDNRIERTGVLKRFDIAQPHIKLLLEVTKEDGTSETWNIESMSPRRWDQNGLDREFVQVGDRVTLQGWPARNGSDEMLLSTIVSEEKGAMVVRNEILQQRAREDVPETIKRQ